MQFEHWKRFTILNYIGFNYFIFKFGIKLNEFSCMSTTITLENLQDSELIRIFLNFVQAYRLQYQKIHKEISYKFYEATWMLSFTKATGYGRSETEAYKSALKNLMEMLTTDPRYADYFSSIVARPAKQKHEENEQSYLKMQVKTEGNQFAGECSSNQSYLQFMKDRLNSQSSKKSLLIKPNEKENQELEEAKSKMRLLEAKLALVLEENRFLKSQLADDRRESLTKICERNREALTESTNIMLNKQNIALASKPSNVNQIKMNSANTSKMNVPKLNLNVLPNYHKKSEKCLNDALLEAYEQKHGHQANNYDY